MGKDKEENKALANPSIRVKPQKKDITEEDMRIWYLENRYRQQMKEHEKERARLIHYYSRLCLYFLLSGIVIGFIVGALVL